MDSLSLACAINMVQWGSVRCTFRKIPVDPRRPPELSPTAKPPSLPVDSLLSLWRLKERSERSNIGLQIYSLTEAEPFLALPLLFLEGVGQTGFACFLHESLDQGEDASEMTRRDVSTRP